MATLDGSVGSRFGIGDTLSTSFGVLFKKFIPLNMLVLIFQLPMLIWSVTSGMFTTSLENPEALAADFGTDLIWVIIVSIILSLASAAAVTYGVFLEITGRNINIGACLSKSVSVLVPVVFTGIIAYIIFIVGTILLIIPGIFALVCLFVVIPVVVVEQPGIFGSLGRSAELTKGNRWAILGLFLVIIGISIVLGLISQFVTFLFVGMGMDMVAVIVSTIVQIITTTFLLVIGAVTYNNLRISKEGISSGEIASVFD